MSSDEPIWPPKPEPEVLRATAKRNVAWHNMAVHEAPWTQGNMSQRGGVFIALEIAEEAYLAHGLPYERGLSKMPSYDPRRFTWIYDPTGEARDCVKIRDNQTGRVVVSPSWFG
jgi:hypothetical protein